MTDPNAKLSLVEYLPESVYVPPFSHPHYHSYEVHDGQLVRLNPLFRTRAEDLAAICNLIGAQSVLDVGCNFGGFVFYMEKMAGKARVWGVDGEQSYIEENRKTADRLDSHALFTTKGLMELASPSTPYDAIILQNVYHYVYDKVGDHLPIFQKLASLGRSIIWYNPMSADDPVIPKHSMSNQQTDWSNYNRKRIFDAAIRAGFLHPVPLRSRSGGMGATREHWLFVLDEIQELKPDYRSLHDVTGVEIDIKPHFAEVHRVFLNDSHSYKVFKNQACDQIANIKQAVSAGLYDRHVCGDLHYLVADGAVVGYIQPRGIEIEQALAMYGPQNVADLHALAIWRMASRMLRHDAFNHDLGVHNFVAATDRYKLNAIDLEGVVFDASNRRQLSIYNPEPVEIDVEGAKRNLELTYPGYVFDFEGRSTGDLLWDCLASSTLLRALNVRSVLGN